MKTRAHAIFAQIYEISGLDFPDLYLREAQYRVIKNPQKTAKEHVAIETYWESFEQHEASHADEIFKQKFSALAEYCEDTYEIGYDMLWQGRPEH